MANILISSGGRRVSLVKAFKKEYNMIDPKGKIYVSDIAPELSAAAHIADKAFKICKVDDPDYIKLLLTICINNNIKLIIPTIDTELSVLSDNRSFFQEKGIYILLCDKKIIDIAENKIITQDFFSSYGIRVAKVYDKKNYKLPIYIKPISGSGSKDNFVVFNENQLSKFYFEENSLHFFEYLDPNLYDEYTCDMYYNNQGKLKCIVPRKRIEVRGGEVAKAMTRKNFVKSYLEEKFSKIEGARGCITIQVFFNKDNNSVVGIEINPRFGGGYPLAYNAGGNYPKWIIEEYLFGKEIQYFEDWKDNLLMLRYDDEIIISNE
ncbi:ATP-grasp domain-containing protein [Hyunsoonleella pacifica]|uniref:ATP-grasp domain-containing protein n=1 Tax=Hyunsoonleella pacifica TaxID=1080224 RepID=A0A4Q9FQA2_9FLAO|nr:ATP-grasp domain-containing protein [Hyunsoonleella pacifica]TBN17621.1 ATP-grasp domain-containing protein [Hyunsoonleella pacifica]GGD10371.1 carbamoyl phosphate synthase large subunit [Hyunsoonleella pacifica]